MHLTSTPDAGNRWSVEVVGLSGTTCRASTLDSPHGLGFLPPSIHACARSSGGLEQLASNQWVGSSNLSGRTFSGPGFREPPQGGSLVSGAYRGCGVCLPHAKCGVVLAGVKGDYENAPLTPAARGAGVDTRRRTDGASGGAQDSGVLGYGITSAQFESKRFFAGRWPSRNRTRDVCAY